MAELLFMEVYNQLGPGFGEAIYQDAMEIEVESRKIPNNPQQDIFVYYFGADKNLELKRMVLTPEKPIRTPRVLMSQPSPRISDPKPIEND